MKSVVVWKGKSELNGAPIALVVKFPSKGKKGNSKTGNITQTYIIPDEYVVKAIHNGRDESVCGNCPNRGDGTGKGRTCYVSLATGLNVVSRHYLAGKYAAVSPEDAAQSITGILRLGTYGDPAAVPAHVWAALTKNAQTVLGYTHQWRQPRFAYLARWCMASADALQHVAQANALGFRTFRVRPVAGGILPGEIACPASQEAGARIQCDKCRLCQGTARKAKNIVIMRHDRVALAERKRLTVLQ